MTPREERHADIEAIGALGLQSALSRIDQITSAVNGSPAATTAVASGGGAASGGSAVGANAQRTFSAALASRALGDDAEDGAGDGGYVADALTSAALGSGSSGAAAYGSAAALMGGTTAAGTATVLQTPATVTLPAGTSITLPGVATATGAATGAGGFAAAAAPVLPLPASADAVGGPGTAGPLGQRIAAIASAELGVAESPPGSNDAPRIGEYRTATVGSGVGPWCAYFCSWVARQAGVPIGENGRGEGWVPAVKEWGEATGRYIAPGTQPAQAGDLVVFERNGDGVLDHIGIVTGVAADGTISTVEGNSSDKVSARRYGPGEYAGLIRLAPPGV